MGELYGGVERQILDLCVHFRREGQEVPLVVLFHDRELAARLRELRVETIVLRGRNRYDWDLMRQMRDVLANHGINVVHAHGYKATIVAGLIKRQLGFRLIKTEHGKLEASLSDPAGWLYFRLVFALEQRITRRAVDAVSYVTQDIQRAYIKLHKGMACWIIPNGIDALPLEGCARPADLPDGVFNVGIVGRVTRIKGIPLAIGALERPEVPEAVHLVIIGTGRLLPRLRRLVRAKGLERRVHFLGFRRNVFDYLAHLDALLMPSYHEGLPYTLLEAMSLQRPIIATRVGGLAEVLQDGQTGLLVPKADVPAIARALVDIHTSEELRVRLGRNARKQQIAHYDLQSMGRAYSQLYGVEGKACRAMPINAEDKLDRGRFPE